MEKAIAMKYEAIPDWNREEALEMLASSDTHAVIMALLAVALNDDDFEYAQSLMIQKLWSADAEVRRVAVIGIGHIARIHGKMDKRTIELLKSL